MRYFYECNFEDEPECYRCMLSGNKGQDLNGETVMACFALGTRPKCVDEGCRYDCPLEKIDD